MIGTIITIALSISLSQTNIDNIGDTAIAYAKTTARAEAVACDPRPKQVIPDSQTGLGLDETMRLWTPDKD